MDTTAEAGGPASDGGDGGRAVPRVGMTTDPGSMNLLDATTAHAFAVLNNVYTLGVVREPYTGELLPWGFRDWELRPEHVGTGRPAVTADLRPGLTFSDGTPVTAGDVRFTVEYHEEQSPPGAHGTTQYAVVESVGVDDPDGTTVQFYLSEKHNAWKRGILGYPILPAHVWRDVADPGEYDPVVAGGPVGSGPFVLGDCEPGEHYELRLRRDGAVPWNELDHADWLDDDGPFLDGVRFEVYDSEAGLRRALLDGRLDVTYDGVSVDAREAFEAAGSLSVERTRAAGWQHFSFNLRRVPLDDPAFRQLLVRLFDREFVVEELYDGVGAERGDYATPPVYDSWRPPPPAEVDEFDGVPVPSLSFPGRPGTFDLDGSAVEAARRFLLDHDRAEREYSLGEARDGLTFAPDGRALYVDGEPLTDAHTDNDGTPEAGPLEVLVPPPTERRGQSLAAAYWVSAMKRVGIPARLRYRSLDGVVEAAFRRAAFDVVGAAWTNLAVTNDHFTRMFSSAGADLDGSGDEVRFNPMGYTGADDLVAEQRRMLRPGPRRPLVREILATIWRDAPTLVSVYEHGFHPVSDRFTGYVAGLGGVATPQTWLNLRPAGEG